jgi:hypothetical protein
MIPILVQLIILLLVLSVAYWIVTILPLPPPFPRIIQVVLGLILLIWLLDLLLGFSGSGGLWYRRGPP